MAVELYRLQVAMKRGGASWGDVRHYEGRERFEADLFRAMLEVEVEGSRWTNTTRAIRAWLKRFEKKTGEQGDAVVTRIIAVQRLVDGEWVDLHPRLLPPRLEFD